MKNAQECWCLRLQFINKLLPLKRNQFSNWNPSKERWIILLAQHATFLIHQVEELKKHLLSQRTVLYNSLGN